MRSVLSALLVLAFFAGHAATSSAKNAAKSATVVLSLQGLDCASCWNKIEGELDKVKGVRHASFDRRTVEARIETDPGVPVPALQAAVERAGFKATEGPGHGRWVPVESFGPDADAAIAVKQGEDVPDLAAILVPKKVTVVDFYADWCGPCRDVDRHMKAVLASAGDVALRKVNVVDWDTPVAKRYLKGAAGLPYVLVYDGAGKKVATIQGLKLDKLDAAIDKARRK